MFETDHFRKIHAGCRNVFSGLDWAIRFHDGIEPISSIFDLRVDKPEMKDNSTEEIKSWINHDTEVHCQAEGVPLPEIIWSRKGTVTSVVQAQYRISTLTFKPRKSDDFGSIACYARNFLGSTEKNLVLVSLGKT